MEKIDDKPSGLRSVSIEGIEIRLWEIYLLRDRTNLHQFLLSYSIKNDQPTRADLSGRISFRFTRYDWDKSLKQLLMKQHIPFEVGGKFLINPGKASRKKKVYVAEDDLNILFALNSILEDAGYDVLMSHCGERMLAHNLPSTDVFILDRLMPGVDGIQVCRHLKDNDSTKDIPVIMISANGNALDEAFAAGASDFLEKPFHMRQLLALVAKHTAGASLDDGDPPSTS